MVLPGIQALFGFQLIAVFNEHFDQLLSTGEQRVHLIALALVAISAALVMSPAAHHREVEPYAVSTRFVRLSGRLLLLSMLPLALGTCLDFYLIANLILGDATFAAICTAFLGAFYLVFWYLLPWLYRNK